MTKDNKTEYAEQLEVLGEIIDKVEGTQPNAYPNDVYKLIRDNIEQLKGITRALRIADALERGPTRKMLDVADKVCREYFDEHDPLHSENEEARELEWQAMVAQMMKEIKDES